MEAEIFVEIKKAEEKAEEMLQKASAESERIIRESNGRASALLMKGMESIEKEKAEKIQQFRDKIHILRETKISEGSETVKKMRQKAQKNRDAAVRFIIEKFHEMVVQ